MGILPEVRLLARLAFYEAIRLDHQFSLIPFRL